MNFGWRESLYMEQFPEWSSAATKVGAPVTHNNELIFNAHNLGLREVEVIVGLVKRTHEEGLSVFLHCPAGFAGIVPFPEKCDPELAFMPFNTLYVNEHSNEARVVAAGHKDPIAILPEAETQIISMTLSQAAAKLFPVQD